MVLVAVAGGTGTAGRAVVAEAVRRGHRVRSISRHGPAPASLVSGAEEVSANFRTGAGVAQAMAGVDVLIETLDARGGPALKSLPGTTLAVLAAAAAAGVRRCVLLSIVHAADCPMAYYQVQAARARSYEAAELPTTVVYATQFHTLVAGLLSSAAGVALIPALTGVSFQPIAPSDMARILVDAALHGLHEGAPFHASIEAGGPTIATMQELAGQWKHATGRRGVVVPVRLPGSFGAFLRAGRNLVPEAAVGTLEFSDWLESRRDAAAGGRSANGTGPPDA